MPDFDAFQVFTLGAALGIATGLRLGYAAGWLLSRPLPRPWRRKSFRSPGDKPRMAALVGRKICGAWRYLAPGGLWRDTVRLAEDFAARWDARHPEA